MAPWLPTRSRRPFPQVTEGGEAPAVTPTFEGRAFHRPAEDVEDQGAAFDVGTLVSRREPGAVLHDEDDVAARMVRLATEGVVAAVDGTDVRVDAESICLHGDTPGAVAMAAAVRRALEGAGVSIKASA